MKYRIIVTIILVAVLAAMYFVFSGSDVSDDSPPVTKRSNQTIFYNK